MKLFELLLSSYTPAMNPVLLAFVYCATFVLALFLILLAFSSKLGDTITQILDTLIRWRYCKQRRKTRHPQNDTHSKEEIHDVA
jgi:hypothetical protein